MIKESAIKVFNALGPGHSESTYHKALSLELNANGINHMCERNITITYEDSLGNNHHLNTERIDILLYESNNAVTVVELKALNRSIGNQEHCQVEKYKRQLNKESIKVEKGIIINFPQPNSRTIPTTIEYLEI